MTNEQRINLLTAALRWYARADTWAHRSTTPPSRAELDRGDRARLVLVAVGLPWAGAGDTPPYWPRSKHGLAVGGADVSTETAVKGTLPGATPGGHAGAAAGVPDYIPSPLTNTAKSPLNEREFLRKADIFMQDFLDWYEGSGGEPEEDGLELRSVNFNFKDNFSVKLDIYSPDEFSKKGLEWDVMLAGIH